MTAAVGEIKKLNEQLSQLRQENIVLKEETLRLKRIAAASEKPHDTPSYSSTTVTAVGPQNEVLPTTHIYAALSSSSSASCSENSSSERQSTNKSNNIIHPS